MSTNNTTKKIPCSVGILTFNNEKTIRRALESVKDFEEIIICDGGSTDDTLNIVRSYNAHVIKQDSNFLDEDGRIADFSAIRNQMFNTAKLPWFAYLDSDEYFSVELSDEIRKVVTKNKEGAFFVSRRYVWNDKEIDCAATYPNLSMRLIARSLTPQGFRKRVHERFSIEDTITPLHLSGVLYVPLGYGCGPNRSKGDYYIRLQVVETLSSGQKFYKLFLKTLLHSSKASILYACRYVRNLIFCRGVHMPFSFEFERHVYNIRLLVALWRARKHYK